MNRYVALLRGVNVGGNRKVPMAELRSVATACGFTEVSTYIASGNLLFNSNSSVDPADALRAAIAAHFGFSVDLVVVAASEFRDAIARCPYDGDESQVTLTFLSRPFTAIARSTLTASIRGDEKLEFVGTTSSVVYAHFPDGLARSTLAQRLHTVSAEVTATTRNLRSAKAIAQRL